MVYKAAWEGLGLSTRTVRLMLEFKGKRASLKGQGQVHL